MLETWQYHNPVRITFGPGSLARLGEMLAGRSYALVTYGEAPFDQLAERIGDLAGAPAVVIDNVAANPDFETLGACSERNRHMQQRARHAPAFGQGAATRQG